MTFFARARLAAQDDFCPVSLELASDWIDAARAEGGLSDNSLRAYASDIVPFLTFLRKKEKTALEAAPEILSEFVEDLTLRGFSERTLARKISALRTFFSYLFAESLRKDNPALLLSLPRLPRLLPKAPSLSETEILFQAAEKKKGPSGARLRAILEILYGSGLRVSELINLPLSSVSRLQPFLIVLGKGGKERMTPLTEPAIEAVEAY